MPGRALEFDETFAAPSLDPGRWLPFYLPHWSSRERAAARYHLAEGCLRLSIAQDQPPWCPEFDGPVRVSSLQTGAFAGPIGSGIGQHRFTPELVVREVQESVRLYTPCYGHVELRAKVSLDSRTMAAAWLIGYEDEPERSAEICICEIFGRDVEPDSALVGWACTRSGTPSSSRNSPPCVCRSTCASFTSTARSGRASRSRSSSTANW
jgi:hypothetical protein